MAKDKVTLDVKDYGDLLEAANSCKLASLMARPAATPYNRGWYLVSEHYIERLARAADTAERLTYGD